MTPPVAAGWSSALAAGAAAAVGAGPDVQALLCVLGALAAFGVAVRLHERRRRSFRSRELDRLSRCLFAAAGARRRSRFR